jgi:hypothetical protein
MRPPIPAPILTPSYKPSFPGYFFLGLLTLPACSQEPAYLALGALTSLLALASGIERQVDGRDS